MDDHPSPPRDYRGLLIGRKNTSSIAKRKKTSKEQNAKQCEDRITNLPCNLISHILSSLPTKNAMVTSVLSTKWKQFWTLITCLDIDDKFLRHSQRSERPALLRKSFSSFMCRVLDRVSCLHKCRLKCCQTYDVSHVNSWIAAILKHHIQELDLSIPMNHYTHVLPQELFSCRTLVMLKLGTLFLMNVPTSVCLPSLRVLHLKSVKFSDDDSIKRLLHGCPVLDELNMNQCGGKDLRVIQISAPVLTKLRYFKERSRYLWQYDSLGTSEVSGYRIVIDTPALLYLELNDYVAEVYLVNNLCHLIKADISIAVQYDQPYSKAITDLLIGISEVQCLRLYNDFAEAFRNSSSEIPMFYNLSSLILGAGYVGRELFQLLLDKSPRLETLVFEEGYLDEFYEVEGPLHWYPPLCVPSCVLLHLKVVNILHFEGHDEEMKMVKYFLETAQVLEKLIIHSDDSYGGDQVEITQELLMLTRGSRTCQVEFVITRNEPLW